MGQKGVLKIVSGGMVFGGVTPGRLLAGPAIFVSGATFFSI